MKNRKIKTYYLRKNFIYTYKRVKIKSNIKLSKEQIILIYNCIKMVHPVFYSGYLEQISRIIMEKIEEPIFSFEIQKRKVKYYVKINQKIF